jgi:hypothetical protein
MGRGKSGRRFPRSNARLKKGLRSGDGEITHFLTGAAQQSDATTTEKSTGAFSREGAIGSREL